MNIKRAAILGAITYFGTFIVAIIYMMLTGMDTSNLENEVPKSMMIFSAFASVILAGVFAWIYFKPKKIKKSTTYGFYLGLILISIGFILDFVTLIPAFIKGESKLINSVVGNYTDPFFILSIVLIVLTTTGVGYYIEKKK